MGEALFIYVSGTSPYNIFPIMYPVYEGREGYERDGKIDGKGRDR